MRDPAVCSLPTVFYEYGMILWFTKRLTLEESKTKIKKLMSYDDWLTLHENLAWRVEMEP